jgi:integrative and conjugative element protein (TIGR02256 family)
MKIWLRQSAQIDMEVEADRAHPLETGGILIGYATRDGLVVERIVGPGPMATATRTSFLPDTAFQQAELNRIYQLSAGKETYLGDWHSHPDGSPLISQIDRRTLRRIAAAASARLNTPGMLILAGHPDNWAIAGYGAAYCACFPWYRPIAVAEIVPT